MSRTDIREEREEKEDNENGEGEEEGKAEDECKKKKIVGRPLQAKRKSGAHPSARGGAATTSIQRSKPETRPYFFYFPRLSLSLTAVLCMCSSYTWDNTRWYCTGGGKGGGCTKLMRATDSSARSELEIDVVPRNQTI